MLILVLGAVLCIILVLGLHTASQSRVPATEIVGAPAAVVFEFLLDYGNFSRVFGDENVEVEHFEKPLYAGQSIGLRAGSEERRVSCAIIVESVYYPRLLVTRQVFSEVGGEESPDFPEFRIVQEIQETAAGTKVTISMSRATECPLFLRLLSRWVIAKARQRFDEVLSYSKSRLER